MIYQPDKEKVRADLKALLEENEIQVSDIKVYIYDGSPRNSVHVTIPNVIQHVKTRRLTSEFLDKTDGFEYHDYFVNLYKDKTADT